MVCYGIAVQGGVKEVEFFESWVVDSYCMIGNRCIITRDVALLFQPSSPKGCCFISLLSGYLAQIIFFKEIPQLLTLVGAGCMLISVVLMALPTVESEPPSDTKAPSADASASASTLAVDSSEVAASEEDDAWMMICLKSFARLFLRMVKMSFLAVTVCPLAKLRTKANSTKI